MLTAELQYRLVEMKTALEARGVAITPRRAKLMEVLLASERHPTASEIREGVRAFFPRTSLATVYNTIELLKDAGQVLEIEFSGASNRYDGRRPHSHPHLVCLRCERIEDLDAFRPDDAELAAVAHATGYQIVRRRIEYLGVCPDCQECF